VKKPYVVKLLVQLVDFILLDRRNRIGMVKTLIKIVVNPMTIAEKILDTRIPKKLRSHFV